METTVNFLKSLGLNWEKNTIGVAHENGLWNVNVVLRNKDGSRKLAYGLLKYETATEAVAARIALQNA